LYGIGLAVVIWAFYTPMLDQGTVASRQGELLAAAVDDAADEREVANRNDGKPSEDDRKAREKRAKEYQKDRPRLLEKLESARAGALKAKWWNQMYRLIGFVILAFGSIGLLIGEHTQFKRILGGATIVLILFEVIGGGSLQIGLGGSNGPPAMDTQQPVFVRPGPPG
jgi:hypothetical protein